MAVTSNADLVEQASVVGFGETLERLEQAIAGAGMTVFARIDHDAGARDVGLTMPPTTVLLYGNPKGGTVIMLAAPQVALDLPLRVLVREALDGKAMVSFHPAAPMLLAGGAPDALAHRLDPAQAVLAEAIRS
jgi:uncharacterized protein (DUF302 family)